MSLIRTQSRVGVLSLVVALVFSGQVMAAEPQRLPATRPAAVGATSQPAGQAAIAVDSAEHDFGAVRAGEKVEYRFKITNTGSAELKITQVKPNCGCTVAGDYPRTLAPGASGEIPLALTTANMNGKFNKTAVVFSNDPARPQLALTLKGEARPLVALEPAGVYFGSVYGEQPKTQVITITNNSETPLKMVLDPLASTGGWAFDLAEKEPGKKFELTATFDPKGLKPGYNRQTAMLLTNVAAQHQIQVQANAAIRNRIEAEPATLMIYTPTSQPAYVQAAMRGPVTRPAAASQPAAVPRSIRVQNYGEQPVKVTDAFADNPALKVTVQEQAAGKSYLVGVSVPQNFAPASGEGITVRTDDAEKPVIRIPVVATQPYQPPRPPYPTTRPSEAHPGMARQQRRPAEQMVGKDAPAFSLTTLEGKTVSKQELSGAVTVLNFFAPNCGFCKKQLPRVETLRQVYEAKGVNFLNVSETMGRTPFTRDAVVSTLASLGVKAQAAIDDNNAVGRLFSVGSFPTMFVLNKAGKVEAVNMGNMADLETRLKSQVEALLTD